MSTATECATVHRHDTINIMKRRNMSERDMMELVVRLLAESVAHEGDSEEQLVMALAAIGCLSLMNQIREDV